MISNDATQNASRLFNVNEKVSAFLSTAKATAADGLTVAEFSELSVALLRIVCDAVDSFPADGQQKKAWVIEAIGMLFDAVAIKAVPMFAIPFFLATRPAIRQIVLAAAAGAIESILPLVRGAK